MSTSATPHETPSVEVLTRFLQRERAARKDAESLLEARSRELYQSNRLLEKEIRRAKAVFDSAAEGIIIFNIQGEIESLNPAGMTIFGLSGDAADKLNICDLIPSASFCQGDSDCSLGQRLKSQMGKDSELIGQHRDGSHIPLELVVSEFTNDNQVNFSGIVRDLTRRKQLETQLAHAQKMESVGQLAAGIAHELNTPIQFVGDNTRFLKSSFQSLQEIIDQVEILIREVDSHGVASGQVQNIRQAFDRADVGFLKEEVPLAIDQTLEGAENVSRIVRAMKVFSHPGSDDLQEVDLNHALESTLTISKSEWKYCATVETRFDAQLPKVRCYPGELNQAFLNIIVNAAHAMTTPNRKELGRLTIRTSRVDQEVLVEIADTGTGIPESIRHRIFDPFFTTKGVGKGTGQGLSIVYHVVVELHHGRLTFESEEGKGTTFRIQVPFDPRPA